MIFLLFLLSRLTGEGNSYTICATGGIHGDYELVGEIEALVKEQKCDELVLTGDGVGRGSGSIAVLHEVANMSQRLAPLKVFPLLGVSEANGLLGRDGDQRSSKFAAWGGRDNWLKLWRHGGMCRDYVNKYKLFHLHKPSNCSSTRSPATLFMHGGVELPVQRVTPGKPFTSMNELQKEVLKLVHAPNDLVEFQKKHKSIVDRRDAMYRRTLSTSLYHPDHPDLCENVQKLLGFSGAVRVVMGRYSTNDSTEVSIRRVLTKCNHTIIYVEVGMYAGSMQLAKSMGALLVIRTAPDDRGMEAVLRIESHVKHIGHNSRLDKILTIEDDLKIPIYVHKPSRKQKKENEKLYELYAPMGDMRVFDDPYDSEFTVVQRNEIIILQEKREEKEKIQQQQEKERREKEEKEKERREKEEKERREKEDERRKKNRDLFFAKQALITDEQFAQEREKEKEKEEARNRARAEFFAKQALITDEQFAQEREKEGEKEEARNRARAEFLAKQALITDEQRTQEREEEEEKEKRRRETAEERHRLEFLSMTEKLTQEREAREREAREREEEREAKRKRKRSEREANNQSSPLSLRELFMNKQRLMREEEVEKKKGVK